MKTEIVPVSSLRHAEYNPRQIDQHDFKHLKKSIQQFGFVEPIVVNSAPGRKGIIIGGNQRFEAAMSLGMTEVPVFFTEIKDLEKEKELNVRLNRNAGKWDFDILSSLFETQQLLDWGFTKFDFEMHGPKLPEEKHETFAEQFLIAPFSVLDGRSGAWQERKRYWLAKGIQSEVGRGENLLKMSDTILNGGFKQKEAKSFGTKGTIYKGGDAWQGSGTSIFDPVLCEIAYKWFCPSAGRILDPFAGGSVRGIVAGLLEYKYTGVELRPEQVAANIEQAKNICPRPGIEWILGDSAKVELPQADFVFSCPPYHDLEKYSEDPKDLSNLSWEEFLTAYRLIIKRAVAALKPNRFACFVVGEIRDKKGFYKGFVPETIHAFEEAGAKLYNEAILVTAVGSLPLRIGRQFRGYRKLGKTHQNVLIFYKGDPKQIKEEFPQALEFLENESDSESSEDGTVL